MVKPSTAEKSSSGEKSSRAATKKEIKETISAALMALRLNPDQRTSFNTLAAETGVSASALYNAFKGHKTLGPAPLHSLRRLSENGTQPTKQGSDILDPHTGPDIIHFNRRIRVLSWSQAGEAVDFEEMPPSWQRSLPTDVTDPQAFAVELVGDSMEPHYRAGNIATVTPSVPVLQNDLVIARIEDQGVVFKLSSRSGDGRTYRFTSYNPAYSPFEVPAERIVWIYPVHDVLAIVKK